MSPLRPGLVLDDKVRLIRQLGEGAMGTVWTARHLALDVDVAVKLIRRFADNEEVRSRFDMEAKAAARIKSPHVVQMLDHGVAEGERPYMVMELLEGESLAQRLERTGWLSVTQCVRVLKQVALALDRAHAVGVVHRDVKPENIFLCPGDDGPFVKLLDFGVAKTTSIGQDPKLTTAGVMIGTPEYMSRQQIISSKHVEPEADLWALTVVAYEMLTGDVPFTGETVGQVCVAVCTGDFLPPTSLRKGLPDGIDGWFEAILSKGARCPYASASELAKSFRAVLLPDRYSISDEISDAFRVRRGTAVGLSDVDDDSSEWTGDESPHDESQIDELPHDDAPLDEGGVVSMVRGSSRRGAGWLLAAGLLPLVVGAALFLTQPRVPPALDSLDLGAPSLGKPAVVAAESPEASPGPERADELDEEAPDLVDTAPERPASVARGSTLPKRPPSAPAAPPEARPAVPETVAAPTPESSPPSSDPPPSPPTSAGPTGDERTDYGF